METMLVEQGKSTPVPPSMLMSTLVGSRSWAAGHLNDVEWKVDIQKDALEELDFALDLLRRTAVPVEKADLKTFRLDACSVMMRRVRAMLDDGAGFAVLDRLPAARYGEEELVRAYWLLASLLARPVAQNQAGDRIYKVHNTGRKALPGSGVRPDQTDMEQNFHNDNSYNRTQPSYIGLLCVRPAPQGGESSILSISSAHNRLLETEPELLARLYEPFWVDRQKEHAPDEAPLLYEPVFTYDDRLKARIGLLPIYNAYAMRGEQMDARGAAALDALKRVFRQPELSFHFTMEAGQIQFVDNLGICHRRTAFVDAPEASRRRLLVRTWLRDEGDVGYDG